MNTENTATKAVNAERDVCRFFERIPESLIEEPEVCEWCEYYKDGYCYHS